MSGDKGKKTASVTQSGSFTSDSVKVVAESIGVSGLSDDALHYMADDVTYRLKFVIQDAVKFMRHGKRQKLLTADFDHALSVHNIEPLYGFHSSEYIPFRHASGGGRDIYFTEEKELDLQDLINGAAPKVPLETSVRAHWLAIDGVQPSIPENPPGVSRDLQRLESLDPSVKASINRPSQQLGAQTPGGNASDVGHRVKVKVPEKLRLKELATHELSIEQQLYYKEVTEACVGSDETRRSEALHSLTSDPGLHQMLPRFSSFISEGVKVNVVQNNLALLIYLMRMVKSLMDNPTLYLEKYEKNDLGFARVSRRCAAPTVFNSLLHDIRLTTILLHELIPSLMSCIVSRQLCLRPDADNHWALRDFAARLLAQLCKTFSTSTNSVQVRITNLLSKALHSETAPLASHYGAIVGLGELGHEVVKTFILPIVRSESDKLYAVIDGPLANNADRIAAEHTKAALLKLLPPVLKMVRAAADTVDDYKAAYGNLGMQLHTAVGKLRQTSTPPSSGPITVCAGSSLLQSRAPGLLTQQNRPQFIMQSASPIASQSRVSGSAVGSVQRTVQMHSVSNASSPQQKYVLVQPPTTPSATRTVGSSVFPSPAASVSLPGTPSALGSGVTVFRMVPGSASSTAGVTSGAKILVSVASDVTSETSLGLFSNSVANQIRPDPSEQNFM